MNAIPTKLGELCTVVTKGTTPTSLGYDFSENGIPFLRIQNISNNSVSLSDILFIDQPTHDALARSKIKAGDFLISIAGTIGRTAIVPDGFPECNCNQAVAILRLNEDALSPRYLLYWLSTKDAINQIYEKKVTATISNLSLGQIKELEIPLPPLEKQKRIAAILDKADAIRRKRQKAIKLADEFLCAVFLDMFGDPVTNPKGWEVRQLGKNIIHANNGLSRRRKVPDNFGEIVLRLQDVHYEGIHFDKELNRIQLDASEKKRFLVNKGDILFIRVNGNPDYVGRSSVFEGYKEDVYHNDHLIRLKVSEAYDPVFLSYCFNYEGGRKIISKQIKTSAGQHTISQSGIEMLEFYMPPIILQKKFVHIRNSIIDIPFEGDLPNDLFASLSQKAFSGQL